MNNLLSQYQRYLMGSSSRSEVVPNLQRSAASTKDGSEPFVVASSEPKAVRNLSKSTIKNYLSDTRHFLSWLKSSIQEPEIKPEHITPAVVKAYGVEGFGTPRESSEPSEIASGASSKLKAAARFRTPRESSEPSVVEPSLATTNRRLSSLRRFGQFLEASGLLDDDPTANLLNPNPTYKFTTMGRVLTQYKNYLKAEDLSNSTIKNYLSDLKYYLVWAEKNNQLLDGNQANVTRN
jgi:site-specific recombinase XerD